MGRSTFNCPPFWEKWYFLRIFCHPGPNYYPHGGKLCKKKVCTGNSPKTHFSRTLLPGAPKSKACVLEKTSFFENSGPLYSMSILSTSLVFYGKSMFFGENP